MSTVTATLLTGAGGSTYLLGQDLLLSSWPVAISPKVYGFQIPAFADLASFSAANINPPQAAFGEA